MGQEPPTAAWYAAGLRFRCQRCGRCCRGPGGYVWVTPAEAEALAVALGLANPAFGRRYLRKTSRGLALVDGPRGDCPFLGQEGCRVYPARPAQCRTWPWWPEVLGSPEAWAAESGRCPGMDQGEIHGADRIAGQAGQPFGAPE